MRALFVGTTSFDNSYLVDVLVDGLKSQCLPNEQFTIITGDHKGAEATVRLCVESRHEKANLVVFDGHIKAMGRKSMIKNGNPNAIYILTGLGSIDSDFVATWCSKGVRANIATFVICDVR